jgi:nucleotide-binding universal stress UspA family protein
MLASPIRPTFVPAGGSASPDSPATASLCATGDLRGRTVLLASDGSVQAQAATLLTAALAAARGARPAVVRAFDVASLVASSAMPSMPIASDPTVVRGALESVRAAACLDLERSASGATAWPVEVVPGPTAAAIVAEADRVGAALITLGLRRRGPLARVLRDETALHVMRDAAVPVLAATAGLSDLPRRVIVGVDFGRAGVRAARAARALVADGGTIVLAYVQPARGPRATEDAEGEEVIRSQGIAAAFERLREELAAPAGITVETALLEGTPAAELAALADRADADLIAVGSRTHDVVDRVLFGSVTAELVHTARCSLLAIPPQRPPRR